MISFRYHVVTIVAVFLALAVGVALGGGPLSELGRSSDQANDRVSSRSDKLDANLEQAEQVLAFQDAFVNTAVPGNLSAILEDRPVAIVTMPGASAAMIKGLTEQVNRAEGSVSGTYAVQPALIAADNKSLADTLGSQLLETVSDSGVADGASTYVRLGGLISRAISAKEAKGGEVDETAQSILSSLAGADMLTVNSGGETRASLILVVLGSEPSTEDGSDKLLASLFAGMQNSTASVVVAGSTETSDSGILQILRDNREFTDAVSSVDSAQTRTGQIATVFALARMGEKTGQFGANGTDGPYPRA